MTNTTTQHIERLLINDGHQFAMVRKADLRALLDIAKADPFQGRYLDRHGEYERKLAEKGEIISECFAALERNARTFRKHGDERRRYMGNNKALLAQNERLDMRATHERTVASEAVNAHIETILELAAAEGKLLRVERFKRKYPSVAALMDVTP